MGSHRFCVGHVLDALGALPEESVQCVVTSPPYFGLRDYDLPPVRWPEVEYAPMPGLGPVRVPAWEGQLGLEPAPGMYIAHLVLVFRELRRVLRRDGTCWVVVGDSYAGPWGNYHPHSPPEKRGQRPKETARWSRRAYEGREGFLPPTARPQGGLKEKDLVGVPWRLAFALQADGWWLRSDIVWSKPNPLPESVRDRFTRSHEYVFLLSRSKRYYFDAAAVAEPAVSDHPSGNSFVRTERLSFRNPDGSARGSGRQWFPRLTRNRRTVWEINAEPFPGAHFAVFPRDLARLCIEAGTSPKACPRCGAPWERVLGKEDPGFADRTLRPPHDGGCGHTRSAGKAALGRVVAVEAGGWRPGCSCGESDGSARCVVLDPFGGAGTATLAAMSLGRDSVYVDLSPEYAELALERCGFAGKRLFDEHTYEVVRLGGAVAEKPERGVVP